jgi:hypothetical protein
MILLTAIFSLVACDRGNEIEQGPSSFDSEKDLISLHYDFAPDPDDGHSAAADRTILDSLFGKTWISEHAVAVSGAYGINAWGFIPESDAVMDAAWNDCGGWMDAHNSWDEVVDRLTDRWLVTLEAGGDVWVKEGGQSDLTADVLRKLEAIEPDLDTRSRVHVVQHSTVNELWTFPAAIFYTKRKTDYIRIPDANEYLREKGGDTAFEAAAIAHPAFGAIWRQAFEFFDPGKRLDFSDTGELLYILRLGALDIDAFRVQFLTDDAR